jgi:ketosteroid isomerase-like protein
VKQMGEDIALLSVNRVRYRTDGQELERLGETYTFRKTADGWKIVVATMHDPDTVLRLA